jgi:hypothetical protein
MGTATETCPRDMLVVDLWFHQASDDAPLNLVSFGCASANDILQGKGTYTTRINIQSTAARGLTRCPYGTTALYGLQTAQNTDGTLSGVDILCRDLSTGRIVEGPGAVGSEGTGWNRMWTLDRDDENKDLSSTAGIDGFVITRNDDGDITDLRARINVGNPSPTLMTKSPPITVQLKDFVRKTEPIVKENTPIIAIVAIAVAALAILVALIVALTRK